MLQGKSVTFIPSLDGDAPEWARVTLEDGTRIVGMKKVWPLSLFF